MDESPAKNTSQPDFNTGKVSARQPKQQHSMTLATGISSARSGEISSRAMRTRIVPWRSCGEVGGLEHLY